jgi:hypothetical protein
VLLFGPQHCSFNIKNAASNTELVLFLNLFKTLGANLEDPDRVLADPPIAIFISFENFDLDQVSEL